jgi:hypothetical protein
VGNIYSQLEIDKEVVSSLEVARDRRPLTSHEEMLRQKLKLKSLALSSLKRMIARQESHLVWLKEGDAPTRFFHMHANACQMKNFICTVEHDGQVLVAEHGNAQAFFQFFYEVLGTPPSRSYSINFHSVGLPQVNLLSLGDHLTEEEVWAVISSLPPDKASGPDGFVTRFLQIVWPIIQPEIMAAFDALWHLDTRNLHDINDVVLVLLPKSAEANSVKDYHPISLIHIIGVTHHVSKPHDYVNHMFMRPEVLMKFQV